MKIETGPRKHHRAALAAALILTDGCERGDASNHLKKAGDKAAQFYYPPYVLSKPEQTAGADRYIEMIEWEEAANRKGAKPRSKRLYEISCRERKILTISTILYKSDGTTTSSSDFDRRSPIIPDSTGEALENMLCR